MNQRIRSPEVLMLCVLLVVLGLAVIAVPRWLYPPLSAPDLRGAADAQVRIQLQQAQSQLANDARSAVLQGLAGVLVVIGAIATWRQVRISREGQITDRFSRAIGQLGSEVTIVRTGALYALERIARNSRDDRDHIQYLLGAYIRTRMPWPGGAPAAEALARAKAATVLRRLRALLKAGALPREGRPEVRAGRRSPASPVGR